MMPNTAITLLIIAAMFSDYVTLGIYSLPNTQKESPSVAWLQHCIFPSSEVVFVRGFHLQ